MSRRKARANASEINKSPDVIKYVWMLVMKNGSVTIATSYQTLQRADLSSNIERLCITDLTDLRLFSVDNPSVETVERLMEDWREEYFNEEWDIEKSFSIQ